MVVIMIHINIAYTYFQEIIDNGHPERKKKL